MSYIDGFILAVPKANQEKFTQHAGIADAAFMEWGAARVLECWEDDIPDRSPTFAERCKPRKTKPWCFPESNGRTKPPVMRVWKK